MARFFHDLFCLGRNRVNLSCGFRPNGVGAISIIVGMGITGVTRVSEGLFRLGLTDVWNQADSIIPSLGTAAASDCRAQLAGRNLAARTIDVRVVIPTGPGTVEVEDVASDANNWVFLSAILRLGSTDM